MTGELYITPTNGARTDAFEAWGVNMGDGFLDTLLEPCSLKDYVENTSRLEHGKHIIVDDPKLASRELSLQFTLMVSNASQFIATRNKFLSVLYAGAITLEVPDATDEVFRLVYKKSTSFAVNTSRTFCKINVKFDEPDPSDRSVSNESTDNDTNNSEEQ